MKILSYVIVGLLGLSLVVEGFAVEENSAEGENSAVKNYRYIKREHGVRFQGTFSISFEQGFKLNTNLSGTYVYNWEGMLEAGPYFNLTLENLKLTDQSAGLLVEYNFIKNQGKRKWIPSLGLTVGTVRDFRFNLGTHASLKSFVARRTAFISTLGYNLHTSFNDIDKSHNVNVRTGLSYYFDFYGE